MRTHRAGTLRSSHLGQTVTLCGWVDARRDHGGVIFVDLRDGGILQIVIDPATLADASRLRNEYVIRVSGTVRERPAGTRNDDLATGEVEVVAETLEVLNEAEPLPFPLDGADAVDEVLRLRYRYLDLRRERLQNNLRLRSRVNQSLRASMDAQEFSEIETPMLIASTPEGARDFVVPSRLTPGAFYALPQSPQLFKQLLMVAGMDRYFQIARCLRDEDLRADRQFEFMQYDMEMSFVTADEVRAVVTEAVGAAVEAVTGTRPGPFGQMTWLEAMEVYGSDKPDLRFGMQLVECTEVFATTEFNAFKAECVKGICVPGQGDMPRSQLDALTDRAKRLGAAGLVWMRVRDGATLESPVAKFLTDIEMKTLVQTLGAQPGDLLLLMAGTRTVVRHALGALRLDLGRPPVNVGGLSFLWVVDFPLFEAIDDDGNPVPAHHPFTMPHADDVALLDTAQGSALLDVRAQAYDLVCNGWELGSGSVRIFRREVQQRIFELLGISAEQAQSRFGFLLDAFRYGAPPHAGFAFGIDRLVALLAGEENIREVIAYPKTQAGHDPLTGAPTPIASGQLKELGINVLPTARPS
ncbi:MAG: aspartate--tRNA ligase [Acidimicrobiia bacterium]